jgi:putative RNA 2'-phosphotransferase
MTSELKVKISRYMSYLLRHNPQSLGMDEHGFVSPDKLMDQLKKHYEIDRLFVQEIVEKSERERFEVVGDRIRALYGHSIPVTLELEEDRNVKVLYHGTTAQASSEILKSGLRSMGRERVHLSPTIEAAMRIGRRRTSKPAILKIDAEKARSHGIKFYKATETVYLCRHVPPGYIERIHVPMT